MNSVERKGSLKSPWNCKTNLRLYTCTQVSWSLCTFLLGKSRGFTSCTAKDPYMQYQMVFLYNSDVGCSSTDLSGVESFKVGLLYFSHQSECIITWVICKIAQSNLNSSAEKSSSVPHPWDSLFLTPLLSRAFGTETCIWKSKPNILLMLACKNSRKCILEVTNVHQSTLS